MGGAGSWVSWCSRCGAIAGAIGRRLRPGPSHPVTGARLFIRCYLQLSTAPAAGRSSLSGPALRVGRPPDSSAGRVAPPPVPAGPAGPPPAGGTTPGPTGRRRWCPSTRPRTATAPVRTCVRMTPPGAARPRTPPGRRPGWRRRPPPPTEAPCRCPGAAGCTATAASQSGLLPWSHRPRTSCNQMATTSVCSGGAIPGVARPSIRWSASTTTPPAGPGVGTTVPSSRWTREATAPSRPTTTSTRRSGAASAGDVRPRNEAPTTVVRSGALMAKMPAPPQRGSAGSGRTATRSRAPDCCVRARTVEGSSDPSRWSARSTASSDVPVDAGDGGRWMLHMGSSDGRRPW